MCNILKSKKPTQRINQNTYKNGAICAFDTIKNLIDSVDDISVCDIKLSCDIYIETLDKME